MAFIVRDVSADSDGPTWDIIFTDLNGVQRYSQEVWNSLEEAVAAKESYEKNPEFYPDYWDKLTSSVA